MADLPKGHPKLLNAWAFYDWANSVYTLVIASAVFPIFYNTLFDENNPYVKFLGFNFKNSALISFVTAIAFLFVAFFLQYYLELPILLEIKKSSCEVLITLELFLA